MRLARFAPYALLLCLSCPAFSQEAQDATYSRRNTFSAFFEYSNDSSHILLGTAPNRKIGAIGFQYQRRLLHRPSLDLSYTAEIRPGMLESDPAQIDTFVETAPVQGVFPGSPGTVLRCTPATYPPSTIPGTPPTTVYNIVSCTRNTTVEQGLSPGGVRLNLMPRHRLQPTFSALGGYMFASQPVPTASAAYFNFTFEFGAGLEFYRSHTQSLRLEYQLQHYSNTHGAPYDPGVDSGLIKLTYAFGR